MSNQPRCQTSCRSWRRQTAQGLTEYLLIASLVGLVTVGGLLAINQGWLEAFQPVKQYLASVAQTLPQGVNGALSQLQGQLNAQGGNLSSQTLANQGSYTPAELKNLQYMLSQMSPASLPEVSGSSSDITALNLSSQQLIKMAKQLESSQGKINLDLSDLIMRARILAMAQLFYAAELKGAEVSKAKGLNGLQDTDYVRLPEEELASQIAQHMMDIYPDNGDAQSVYNQLNDGAVGYYYLDSQSQLKVFGAPELTAESQIKYNATYQDIDNSIKSNAINTQQSKVVYDAGGAIASPADPAIPGNGQETLKNVEKLSNCKDANCTTTVRP